MKQLFILSAITAGTLFASTAYSQVYVNAHIGFGLPVRRVYVAPPPTVVYQQPAPVPIYQQPAPAPGYQEQAPGYQEPCPAPGYQDGYDQPVAYENDYPGYVYYNYPVWNGHYRDRVYFDHYRPYFERDYRPYFNRGRFDHVRFEREQHTAYRGGYGGGYGGNRGNGGYRGNGHRW